MVNIGSSTGWDPKNWKFSLSFGRLGESLYSVVTVIVQQFVHLFIICKLGGPAKTDKHRILRLRSVHLLKLLCSNMYSYKVSCLNFDKLSSQSLFMKLLLPSRYNFLMSHFGWWWTLPTPLTKSPGSRVYRMNYEHNLIGKLKIM